MYLQLIKRVALYFMQKFQKFFKIYKMETHKGNRELVSNAKVKSKTIDILMKFKPFRFQVKREFVYDSYRKISIITNDVSINLEGRE